MKAFAAAVVLLAVSVGAASASVHRDVKGVVRRGPIKSICKVGDPCTAPAAGVTVQALKDGRVVAKTTTGQKGRFSFSLAAGYYTIRALGRGAEPKKVHVKTSKPLHLAFMIDTGIR
jgi:hypothetical protein